MEATKASGTLESHYSPNAKVRLMDAKALRTPLKKVPRQILLRTMPQAAAIGGLTLLF